MKESEKYHQYIYDYCSINWYLIVYIVKPINKDCYKYLFQLLLQVFCKVNLIDAVTPIIPGKHPDHILIRKVYRHNWFVL